MNKFIIIGSEPSSILLFRSQLIKDIANLNYEIIAVSNPIPTNQRKAFSKLKIKHKTIQFKRRSYNPIPDLISLFKLIILFKKEKPDIILAYTIKPVIWTGIASLLTQSKYYALITGLGYAFHGKGLVRGLIKILVKFLYKIAMLNSSKVIFQNVDNKEVFLNSKIIKPNKAVLVNGSGVDINFYKKIEIPTKLSFLQISRLLGEKGVIEYCKAAELVKEQYPEVSFNLLGEEDYSRDGIPIEKIKNWQNKKIINFFESTDDVRPYIANSSVFVLPSYHEGIPRSVLEAMSMGRAIITTDAPGCRETLEDGINGWLVRVGDVNHLVEKMIWFINNQEKITPMGNESLKIIKKKFDINIVNNSMLKIMDIQSK